MRRAPTRAIPHVRGWMWGGGLALAIARDLAALSLFQFGSVWATSSRLGCSPHEAQTRFAASTAHDRRGHSFGGRKPASSLGLLQPPHLKRERDQSASAPPLRRTRCLQQLTKLIRWSDVRGRSTARSRITFPSPLTIPSTARSSPPDASAQIDSPLGPETQIDELMNLECEAQAQRIFAQAERMQNDLRSKVHHP
ncbi:hypothetical protein T484DRAFT_3636935 [Baffinella frigidus]|nr:hypothetical protein T484DRAFT_3636935 [Cryptophyta sp. CCMP2293]